MRLGLRGQIVVALVLVTVGATATIGAIAVWQTRQALADERIERAAALTVTAQALVNRGIDLADAEHAVGAEELVVLRGSAAPEDARGFAAASAGAPPHTEQREAGGDVKLVAYARLSGGGVLKATFSLDRAVDARLSRARTSLLLLGAVDALVLLVAAAWMLRSSVVRPVRDLEAAAQRVAAGDLSASATVRGPGELGRLADSFDRMTRSLREGRESLIRSEKLASVGRLAAGVAHEVGNPLAAILGYVDTLLTDSPDKPIDPALRRDILSRVHAETERIHHIIQELLDYSRPPADDVGPVEVRKAVDAAISLVRAQSRGRAVGIDVDLAADLPAVRASAGRLTQLFLNLILNAVDATGGKGSISITAARAKGTDGRLVVSVSDDGPGIPAEARDRLFDPFFTTKEPGEGTGLGLAVSSSIVESYGGRLRLADSDRGARFDVELPIA